MPMDRVTSAQRPRSAELAVPAPRDDGQVAIPSGLRAMAYLDRRQWMVLGGIAAVGAAISVALARDLHRSPAIPVVIMAAMAASGARVAWTWLRGSRRRARLREGVLSHVEEYGGGVYGTGAALTLLVLSAASLQEDWSAAGGVADFVRGMSWEWFVGFSGESIRNAVLAAFWPIHWFTTHGLMAVAAVALAAWAGDALANAWRRRDPLPADAGAAAETGAEGQAPTA
jgi:hypothetical protein